MNDTDEVRLKAIGDRIKELRKSAGYTSHETYAHKVGIERKQYWRLEKGKNFTMATLLRILKVHNISLKEFFEEMD